MRRTLPSLVATCVLLGSALTAHRGSAAGIQGTLGNGWQRHAAPAAFDAVYAGTSGLLAFSNYQAWTSTDGAHWKLVSGNVSTFAERQGIRDFNIVRTGVGGATRGETHSIKAEGPNGGYIAVGAYRPGGKPVTDTRAEVAISADGRAWRHIPDAGKAFRDAEMTDVARGGPGWVAVGFSWGPVTHPLIWTSPDAVHWSRITQRLAGVGPEELGRLFHGPGGLLAVADGFEGPARAWVSADGVHWRLAPGDPFRDALLQQVTSTPSGYLAAGTQDDDPAVWSSSDGLHWQRVAGAPSFPGNLTELQGIAQRGSTVAVVGRYQTAVSSSQVSTAIPSTWLWTPGSSAVSPTPIPHAALLDPKLFRLRLSDLPAGYSEQQLGGISDLCDDGSTLCTVIYRAVGSYRDYSTSFVGRTKSGPLVQIQSMAIRGTKTNPRALASVGGPLMRWWNRGAAIKRVPISRRIGQTTRVYRATGSGPAGISVVWQDGPAIGEIFVSPMTSESKASLQPLALSLAGIQWQHYHALHT